VADAVNYCSWFMKGFCITQSEWASWAQAIMSVVAIFAAARLATSQERRAAWRKVRVVSTLVEMNSENCFTAYAFFVMEHTLRMGNQDENIRLAQRKIEQTNNALKAIELHDLPDQRLIRAIDLALTSSSEALELVTVELDSSPAAASRISERLRRLRENASHAQREVIAVSFDYSGFNPMKLLQTALLKYRQIISSRHAASARS